MIHWRELQFKLTVDDWNEHRKVSLSTRRNPLVTLTYQIAQQAQCNNMYSILTSEASCLHKNDHARRVRKQAFYAPAPGPAESPCVPQLLAKMMYNQAA